MGPHVLKGIYAERSKWETEILKHQQGTTADERTQRSGLSKGKKASGGNHMSQGIRWGCQATIPPLGW